MKRRRKPGSIKQRRSLGARVQLLETENKELRRQAEDAAALIHLVEARIAGLVARVSELEGARRFAALEARVGQLEAPKT